MLQGGVGRQHIQWYPYFQTMENHTLDKVRRENLIVKSVSGGLSVVTR